jgi:hypothetical protein
LKIKDEEGRLCERNEDVGTTFQQYFRKLFQIEGAIWLEHCLKGLEGRISGEINESLLQEFSKEEVRAALFQILPSKALVPDRFSAGFF